MDWLQETSEMPNDPYPGFDPALTVVLAEAFDRAWSTAESSARPALLWTPNIAR
jgi:hypothetical protein